MARPRSSRRGHAAALFAVLALAAACGRAASPKLHASEAPTSTGTVTVPAPPPAAAGPASNAPTAILLAAGDIASCSSDGDEATAALLDGLVADHPDAVVAALGDNAYESGSAAEYARCYGPTWGRFKDRTRPAVGNHEEATPGAAGYRGYFGVGPESWYSYELGTWHVVVLDSNCGVVGCAAGGEQERWLRADLAAHPARCTLAYWHHPRFSSGSVHGSDGSVDPLFKALADGGAEVVLSGHEHNYERFAPAGGVREFVVGTGGRSHYPFASPVAGSEVRNADTFGVLALTLRGDGYDWQFVPVAGGSFSDRGSEGCH